MHHIYFNMIHFSKILSLAQRKNKDGRFAPFSVKFIKVSTGEVIAIDKASYSSSFNKGTMNIKIISSDKIRKIIIPLIIEFNGSQVYM